MTKISHFSLLSLCAISLLSCSGFKRHPSVEAKIAKTQGETIDLNDQDILLKRPRTGEYTHEMAEANPDDNEIKKELGANEVFFVSLRRNIPFFYEEERIELLWSAHFDGLYLTNEIANVRSTNTVRKSSKRSFDQCMVVNIFLLHL
jgi:hypothetical protein